MYLSKLFIVPLNAPDCAVAPRGHTLTQIKQNAQLRQTKSNKRKWAKPCNNKQLNKACNANNKSKLSKKKKKNHAKQTKQSIWKHTKNNTQQTCDKIKRRIIVKGGVFPEQNKGNGRLLIGPVSVHFCVCTEDTSAVNRLQTENTENWPMCSTVTTKDRTYSNGRPCTSGTDL